MFICVHNISNRTSIFLYILRASKQLYLCYSSIKEWNIADRNYRNMENVLGEATPFNLSFFSIFSCKQKKTEFIFILKPYYFRQ